jgi:hypothetical protein
VSVISELLFHQPGSPASLRLATINPSATSVTKMAASHAAERADTRQIYASLTEATPTCA